MTQRSIKATVAALPVPYVPRSELLDSASPVNITLYSGKRKGAMYCSESSGGSRLVLYVAGGELPVDKWYSGNEVDDITPA